MKPTLLAAVLIAMAAVTGCETATPYQPLGVPGGQASGGYFDHQIEANRWQVGFKGNDVTGRQTVERYLLYRAAELTVAQGYDWFEAVQRHTDRTTDTYSTGAWGPYWGLHQRGYGWGYGYRGDPFWGAGAVDFNEVDKFEASAEILLGHGPKPADRQAFDARSVLQHLSTPAQPATRS